MIENEQQPEKNRCDYGAFLDGSTISGRSVSESPNLDREALLELQRLQVIITFLPIYASKVGSQKMDLLVEAHELQFLFC